MPRPIKKRLPKLSIFEAALEFDVDRNFLTRELKKTFPNKRDKYTVGEVFAALNSDENRARGRTAMAKATLIEIEAQEASNQVMRVDTLHDAILDFAEVARNEVSAAKTEGDLEDAKRTLLRHVSGIKKNWVSATEKLLQDSLALSTS